MIDSRKMEGMQSNFIFFSDSSFRFVIKENWEISITLMSVFPRYKILI